MTQAKTKTVSAPEVKKVLPQWIYGLRKLWAFLVFMLISTVIIFARNFDADHACTVVSYQMYALGFVVGAHQIGDYVSRKFGPRDGGNGNGGGGQKNL